MMLLLRCRSLLTMMMLLRLRSGSMVAVLLRCRNLLAMMLRLRGGSLRAMLRSMCLRAVLMLRSLSLRAVLRAMLMLRSVSLRAVLRRLRGVMLRAVCKSHGDAHRHYCCEYFHCVGCGVVGFRIRAAHAHPGELHPPATAAHALSGGLSYGIGVPLCRPFYSFSPARQEKFVSLNPLSEKAVLDIPYRARSLFRGGIRS